MILEKWERSKGHHWRGEAVMRNAVNGAMAAEFVCGVCGKVCKSKAGVVIHRRRMHEVSKKKKLFKCEGCQEEFGQVANLWNHKKVCGGGASSSEKRMCVCGREFAKSYRSYRK